MSAVERGHPSGRNIITEGTLLRWGWEDECSRHPEKSSLISESIVI